MSHGGAAPYHVRDNTRRGRRTHARDTWEPGHGCRRHSTKHAPSAVWPVGRGLAAGRGSSVGDGTHGADDVARVQSDVLHPRPAIEVDVLLDLGLPFTGRRLVNRHLRQYQNSSLIGI